MIATYVLLQLLLLLADFPPKGLSWAVKPAVKITENKAVRCQMGTWQ